MTPLKINRKCNKGQNTSDNKDCETENQDPQKSSHLGQNQSKSMAVNRSTTGINFTSQDVLGFKDIRHFQNSGNWLFAN